ncbi:hypothetical protein ACRW9N_10885 [Listeria aquatica]|uniref:hypothetical protein n=1 Tax=Listeria aquatica TaxID=1494960 RepID=UPI003EF91941
MKKWLLASLGLLLALGLSACGDEPSKEKEEGAKANTTDVKKASASPEADQVAKQAFQAIVDWNVREIYEDYSSKEYQEYLISDKSKDTNFQDLDRQMIHEDDESLVPGEYKQLIDSKDYFFAVYDQFKEKGALDYVLIGSTEYGSSGSGDGTPLTDIYSDNTDMYVYRLELIKEDGKWKLNAYQNWPNFNDWTTKKREARVQEMVKGDNEAVTVLHRGKSFVTDSN